MRLLICTQKMDMDDSVLGFTHRWVLEFSRVYKEVTVICLFKGRTELPENVRVFSLGKEAGVSRFIYLKNFFTYIFRERARYDHVFVHMNQIYVLLGALLWRLWGKKIGFWYAHGLVPFSARVAAHMAHVLFTSTEHGFPIAIEKRCIVGQGIDVTQFQCPTKTRKTRVTLPRVTLGRVTLVSVGRLSPIKNFEVLIEAVAILRERGQKAALTLIGGADTPDQKAYDAKLRTFVKEKNLEQLVDFVGPIPNYQIKTHLCEADIFVNPGTTGSLDKTGLEAIAAGLPLLTCNPAYEAVFREYANRFMFAVHDATELADKIVAEMQAKDGVSVAAVLQERVRHEHGLDALTQKIKRSLESVTKIS